MTAESPLVNLIGPQPKAYTDSTACTAQTSATQVQALKVRQLEDDVAVGRGDEGKLARERGLLGKMTRRLNVLTSDFQSAAVQASRSVTVSLTRL